MFYLLNWSSGIMAKNDVSVDASSSDECGDESSVCNKIQNDLIQITDNLSNAMRLYPFHYCTSFPSYFVAF